MRGSTTAIFLLGVLFAFNACNPSAQKDVANERITNVVEPDALTQEERAAGKFTPEIMWKLGRIGSISLSPDRKTLLYTVTHYNMRANRGTTRVYLQPVNSPDVVLLHEGGHSPQWRPDGERIAFLKSVEGVVQLFETDLEGEDAVQLTDFSEGIESFWYSPDGSKLLYSQFVQIDPTTTDRYPDMDKANVRIIDSLMYRHWNHWVDGRYSHLFLTDYSSNRIEEGVDLMPGEPWSCPMSSGFDPAEVAWAPTSDAIYYTCKKQTGREYAVSTNSHIYLYTLADKSTRSLTTDNQGYDRYPVPSADGKTLLWQRMVTPGYESDRARLMAMDLETGEMRELTPHFDQNADVFQWSPDGSLIYILSGIRGTQQLFSLSPETLDITQITDGQWNVNWAGLTADGEWIVQKTQLNHAAELYAYCDGEMRLVTHINDEIYDAIRMSRVEGRWMKTTNGENMLTWIVYPPDFDSTKRYPAILYCSGGPQNTVSQFWSYRWNLQLMASQGYVVVAPNRHGVPSFGQAWNAQISGDYSGQNIRDYLTAIDNVAKEPWCDEERLSAVGASYGGYSVFYLAGVHEGRFKALIAHNGMFNFSSFYASTEETFFPNHDFGGAYWDHSNATAQRTFANSPHLLVHKWDTPILIVVGEYDFRIAYTEGLQAFNAAQLRGVPARLLAYPDETHFVTGPQNAIIWQREFFAWLDRWTAAK